MPRNNTSANCLVSVTRRLCVAVDSTADKTSLQESKEIIQPFIELGENNVNKRYIINIQELF